MAAMVLLFAIVAAFAGLALVLFGQSRRQSLAGALLILCGLFGLLAEWLAWAH